MSSVFGRVRLLGFGLLAVTFLVGALAGAAVERMATDDSPAAEAQPDDRGNNDRERSYIIDRIEMSGTQRAAIDSILARRAHRMRAVWREVAPRMDAITDSTRADIMEVLSPEQQAEYERLVQRRRRGRSGDERGDGTPGGKGDQADSAASPDAGNGPPPDSGGG